MTTTSEVRTVSSTGGEKGVKDARFDLLPPAPLHAVANHYGIGARKYEDRNWERGYEWSKSYGALQRHLNAFWSGEDIDEETGSPHLAAAAFHVLALMEFGRTHPEFDDRPATAKANDDWQWQRDQLLGVTEHGVIMTDRPQDWQRTSDGQLYDSKPWKLDKGKQQYSDEYWRVGAPEGHERRYGR